MAIEHSSKYDLGGILLAIIRASPDAALIARKKLLDINESDSATSGAESATYTANNDGKAQNKTCKHCDQPFDPSRNAEDACSWYTGVRIADLSSDTWDDWVDKNDGLKEEYIDEYPEGFPWTCCDNPGDGEKGCKVGKHKAGHARKNPRQAFGDGYQPDL